jgi:5-oxopent-3-ene-1,2,5-tricarboxylate decarboxylase/2-hydroxyhepta-2,4-diene-1,7-dioate isomerase
MSVLEGAREEWRRILHEGQPKWVRPEGERLRLGDGRHLAEAEATYLPPCDPTKILCIHLNYESRRVEFRAPQLAKPMRNVGREQAWEYIAGFAPANDVGCQDYRDTDAGSMLRVKGQDGFCPIGPGIVRGVDVRKSIVRTYLNGKVVQEGAVSEMLFPIDYILADLCRFITLLPGDVILSGTPKNSRPMNVGDVVEVEVDGLGRLSNRVLEAPPPAHAIGHQPTDTDSVRRVALGSDFVRTEAR